MGPTNKYIKHILAIKIKLFCVISINNFAIEKLIAWVV